ncbi:hypothetical protein HPB50_004701 [Hyalomma asiaticum]|uniref:Uncharacterized protein n=1 Tax=Hyalomma asiaticum TaxID=266040 RepID=A0ACB7SSC2_HYAAI|nr:hypothetical protein HPB50_004701 [Hyalomma asiaticum]
MRPSVIITPLFFYFCLARWEKCGSSALEKQAVARKKKKAVPSGGRGEGSRRVHWRAGCEATTGRRPAAPTGVALIVPPSFLLRCENPGEKKRRATWRGFWSSTVLGGPCARIGASVHDARALTGFLSPPGVLLGSPRRAPSGVRIVSFPLLTSLLNGPRKALRASVVRQCMPPQSRSEAALRRLSSDDRELLWLDAKSGRPRSSVEHDLFSNTCC